MTNKQLLAAYKVIGFGQVMVDAIEELEGTRFFRGKPKAYMSDFKRKYEQWEKAFYKNMPKEDVNEALNISIQVEQEFEKAIEPHIEKEVNDAKEN